MYLKRYLDSISNSIHCSLSQVSGIAGSAFFTTADETRRLAQAYVNVASHFGTRDALYMVIV